MEPLRQLEGVAAPLPIDNVDTDAIIPSRETQSVARTGYGEKLFANWRYEPGTRLTKPDFVLNKAPFDNAVFLVSGANFGCGSSREAAVWALKQFGVRCVIAESFGAIFYNNCMRNSLLPIVLKKSEIAHIFEFIKDNHENPVIGLDLEECAITVGQDQFTFEVDSRDRDMLLSGLDEVELTLRNRALIEAFREQDSRRRPWLYEPRHGSSNQQ